MGAAGPADPQPPVVAAVQGAGLGHRQRCRQRLPGRHELVDQVDLVGTVGMLEVPNGSINVVPGRCLFSLDLRAPNDPQRDAMVSDVLAKLQEICARRGLRDHCRCNSASAPTLSARGTA